MNHPAAPLRLDAEDRSTLEVWARGATAPPRAVSRAKALLMAGDGVANSRIATALGISRPTVLDWRARFRAEGLDSVGAVRSGRGRKPEITADPVQAIVGLYLNPPDQAVVLCVDEKSQIQAARGRLPRTCGRRQQ